MPWKTVAGQRPPDKEPTPDDELPYPPAITPDRGRKPKPASKAKGGKA